MIKGFGASVIQGEPDESWDCSTWGRDTSGRSYLCVQTPDGGSKDDGDRLFPVVPSDRTRDRINPLFFSL